MTRPNRVCIEEGCTLYVYRGRRCSEHYYDERDRLRGPLNEHQRETLASRQAYWGWDDTKLLYIVGLILDRKVKSVDDLTAREADKVTSRLPASGQEPSA